MIYLGGTWPDEYRNRIFMNNIHGQRLNTDILKRDGSGFVGSHGPDFLLTGDLASQMLNIPLRPGWQRVCHRLVRHERLPPQQRGRPRPQQRPDLQGFIRRQPTRSRSISRS